MEPSYVTDFLQTYEKQTEQKALPRTMDVAEAEALQDGMAAVVEPLPLPDLDPQQREDAGGKRFPELQELMLATADALRRCPEVAQEVGIAPDVLEATARQDMSIGGFIKGMQALALGGDTGALLAAGEGADLCQQTEDALRGALADSTLDESLRRSLGFLFADALRVSSELQKDANTPAPAAPLPGEAELAREQERQQARQLIQPFLMDLESGQADFLSQARPAAAPGKTKSKKAAE